MFQSLDFVDEKTGNPQRLASSIEVMLLLEKRATELEFDFLKSSQSQNPRAICHGSLSSITSFKFHKHSPA